MKHKKTYNLKGKKNIEINRIEQVLSCSFLSNETA